MYTFKQLVDLTKNRIDELDPDMQIDTIIKDAINHAYIFKISKVNKRFKSAKLTVTDGMITLPSDLLFIEKITPSLSKTDYRKGNVLFVNAINATEYTIIYCKLNSPLVNDNDTPDCDDGYQYTLTTYACYAYQLYRKRNNLATAYMQEFLQELQDLEENDSLEFESVTNVY